MTTWLRSFPGPFEPEATVVAFPYAGGSASVYASWRDRLPSTIGLCAAQLPGRQDRIKEPPETSMPVLAERLAREIIGSEDVSAPVVLLGHSMGGFIAAHVARSLIDLGRRPALLVVSGASLGERESSQWTELADDELLDALVRLGGMPCDLLGHPDLVDAVMLAVRGDLELAQPSFDQELLENPLDVPVVAVAGAEDPLVPPEGLDGWTAATTSATTVIRLPGGHFMPWDQPIEFHARLQAELIDKGICHE